MAQIHRLIFSRRKKRLDRNFLGIELSNLKLKYTTKWYVNNYAWTAYDCREQARRQTSNGQASACRPHVSFQQDLENRWIIYQSLVAEAVCRQLQRIAKEATKCSSSNPYNHPYNNMPAEQKRADMRHRVVPVGTSLSRSRTCPAYPGLVQTACSTVCTVCCLAVLEE